MDDQTIYLVYVIPPKMEGQNWQNLMQAPVYWPDPKTKKPREFNSKKEILQTFKTDKNLDGVYADVKTIEDLNQRGVYIEKKPVKKKASLDFMRDAFNKMGL
tara:strand:- start:455 stop:760 length:306 start_codon:yes stop_codon:yes gene_type:complete